jgi:uncharacterized membrane protein
VEPETLVGEYIGRLEASAAHLPTERRDELVGEVREHIEFALAEAGSADEATVRNVLDRLGSPEEIVAAETRSDPLTDAEAAPMQEPSPGSRAISVETRALILLTVGAVILPFVGPLLGLWVAASSTRWTLTQKRTAALIVLVLLALPAIILLPAIIGGELTWVIGTAGCLIPFVPLSGIVAAAYLVGSSSWVVTVSRRAKASDAL